MTHEENINRAMGVFNEIALTDSADNGEERYTFSYSEIKSALKLILEMINGWKYPSKGELPEKHKPIWGVPLSSSVAVEMTFLGKCFDSKTDYVYDIEEVECWTYLIAPPLPTNRSLPKNINK